MNWGSGAVLFVLLTAVSAAGSEDALRLRQEHNLVAAAIDTLARQQGSGLLDALPGPDGLGLLPAGMRLVLVFWADDEAEVYLNGYRVGETRLTPLRVEIPSLYLRDQNLLRAHSWDTDRVESGFMAGLYLEDSRGGLRPVVLSGEQDWKVEGDKAQEIYYAHSVPDIPGARVIWGEKLFGEVWMEAQFAAGQLAQAVAARPRRPVAGWQDRTMAAQAVLDRLSRLQDRRRELLLALETERSPAGIAVAYQGQASAGLAFTTGPVAPLDEVDGARSVAGFQQWREGLPQAQQLLFPKRRPLKGEGAMTPPRASIVGGPGREDRRVEYQPPPERGQGGQAGGGGGGAALGWRRVRAGAWWAMWSMAAVLVGYSAVLGRQWWRIYDDEVWKR